MTTMAYQNVESKHRGIERERERERKHIKMLRGRESAMKLSTKVLTELIEQRSSFNMSTRADSFSCSITCLASFADSMFLAPIITWTFRRANTRAVSNPIPLAPPAFHFQCFILHNKINLHRIYELH